MTIVLTGGGSGGHITPILAVADELKQLQPDVRLIYIGQKGDKLGDIPKEHPSIDQTYAVRAGKWRRYHGEGWRQIFDIPTLLKNIRDVFYVIAGMWQSYWLLRKLSPDIMLIKGGFVGLPVGLMAAMRGVPYITHDSDAIPGLTNRLIARWALLHAVAMPKELYNYPQDKTEYVGVPITKDFKPVSEELQATYKHELQLDNAGQVIFVTGGGLGAQRLNDAILAIAPELLKLFPKLTIVQAVGRAHEADLQAAYAAILDEQTAQRVVIKGYISDLYRYSGAADIVIARAGATNMAELAAQHKACVIVPNPLLTGGHQVKNVKHLEGSGAVVVVGEGTLQQDKKALLPVIEELLSNDASRSELGEKFGTYAKPNAAHDLAALLLKSIEHKRAENV